MLFNSCLQHASFCAAVSLFKDKKYFPPHSSSVNNNVYLLTLSSILPLHNCALGISFDFSGIFLQCQQKMWKIKLLYVRKFWILMNVTCNVSKQWSMLVIITMNYNQLLKLLSAKRTFKALGSHLVWHIPTLYLCNIIMSFLCVFVATKV